MPDLDNLPPTQYMVLEVLAARYRLGEELWTFPVRLAAALRDLQALGLITVMHGITERTLRASLTDAGREDALGEGYVSPAEALHRLRDAVNHLLDLYDSGNVLATIAAIPGLRGLDGAVPNVD